MRLARFNVQSSIGKASGDFIGIPIPMAGGAIACYIAMKEDLSDLVGSVFEPVYTFVSWCERFHFSSYFLLAYGVFLALLMVSNIEYRSHKSIIIKQDQIKPFSLLAILAVAVGLIAYRPALVGFILFFLYSVSGVFEWAFGFKKSRDDDEIFEPQEEEESLAQTSTSSNKEDQ